MKKHKRQLQRLSKRFGITYEEAIQKFYKNKLNKNVYFSLHKKRNKGKNKGKNKLD
jgi:hypothetical protein